jgi:hypothetical protein
MSRSNAREIVFENLLVDKVPDFLCDAEKMETRVGQRRRTIDFDGPR